MHCCRNRERRRIAQRRRERVVCVHCSFLRLKMLFLDLDLDLFCFSASFLSSLYLDLWILKLMVSV